jgi:uncharacterized SAM-binding protein YcdF (DUF218 family)
LTRNRRAIAIATGVGLLAAAFLVLTDAPARYLVLEDEFDLVDAALVMAGDPGYERTTMGARLVLSGRARLLILTGGEAGPGDSSDSLRAWAVQLGVGEAQIRTESVSAGTWSSMRAVEPILRAESIRTIALVTSPYHQRRAFLTAVRAFGPAVRVFNHPARPSTWSPRRFWADPWSLRIVATEHVKLAYYAFRGWI